MLKKKYFLGVDIGGTKCAVLAGTAEMEILDRIQFDTKTKNGLEYTISKLLETASVIVEKFSGQQLISIGISCGGPLNSKLGIIQSPPNLPGWDNIEIVKIFNEKFNVPVFLQNDANACALAEWRFGAGKGTQNMIFLTFGTGLGAGLILDGKLYTGTNDNGGEVGHIRLEKFGPVGYGKTGSFEGFCSGSGIAQLARLKAMEKIQMGEKISFCKDMNDLQNITAQTVADAAKKGDLLAIEIFEICGTYLGKGLSILIDILNPECIVIGSIFTRAGELLIPAMRKIIETEALPLSSKVCRIVPAELNEQIGDMAALSVAMN
jgi:glucokinase